MKCKLCDSDKVGFVEDFKPYIDKDWSFKMYDCHTCQSRFCLRNSNINYHEEIHSSADSPYQFHYTIATNVKEMFNDLHLCEKYLSSRSPIFQKMMKYVNKQARDINILEVGCSTGYVTAFLQQKGFQNTLGIDISQSAISHAEKEFGAHYALKEDHGKKYDVIFHSGLIGCVNDPIEFLEHYLSLLSKDGVMFFNAPDVDSIKQNDKVWVSTPPPDLVYLFNKDIFINLFSEKFVVKVEKTLTPLNILKKNLQKLGSSKVSSDYPRLFASSKSTKENSNTKKTVKMLVSFIVLMLAKTKILRHYADEYGILCVIKNKS